LLSKILNKDKNFPAKGTKTGKTSTHKANHMDIEPTEKVTHCASLLEITAINESELSRDELNAYMLDLLSEQQFCRSFGKKAKTVDNQTVRHLILFKRLLALRNPSHIILMKSQQTINRKVLSSEFLTTFTCYIDEYTPLEIVT
jgi:hypothetical protein